MEIKRSASLPLDDLREKLITEVLTMSRAQVSRILAKHQLTTHTRPKEKLPKKKFAEYPPGFYHMDTTYMPPIGGKSSCKLLVAIERTTRWQYSEVVEEATAVAVEGFTSNLIAHAPIKPLTSARSA